MQRNKKKGFTLIELLVVISIIALLVSILMPALAKARQTAKMAVCASNQRQVAIAVIAYESEHQKVPAATSNARPSVLFRNKPTAGSPREVSAYKSLGAYLSDVEIFNCPMSGFDKNASVAGNYDYQELYTKIDTNTTMQQALDFSLNSSYMLLWNHKGFAKNSGLITVNSQNKWNKPFVGPGAKLGGNKNKNKLLICDDFKYTRGLGAGQGVEDSWQSAHKFAGGTKKRNGAFAYNIKFKTETANSMLGFMQAVENDNDLNSIMLNAGYIDGHVEKYSSADTIAQTAVTSGFAINMLPVIWK